VADGMHGYRALEGHVPRSCIFSGRIAGRAAAQAVFVGEGRLANASSIVRRKYLRSVLRGDLVRTPLCPTVREEEQR